ncbi:MAG: glycosyltransferase family 4 protein [Candidatus Doudnabacteria bacterium]|nr:glycosyltransferase family 4 protein [Candidatus Doudnabacteria bacterium]
MINHKTQTPRIGIDMRMAGEGYGIGRYVVELATALLKRPERFSYWLIFDKGLNYEVYRNFSRLHNQCLLVPAHYYSLAEQIALPFALSRAKLDLMHFPNFNVPLAYQGEYVVTIHDLIHHRFPGKRKRNIAHRLAYRLIISLAVKKAKKIIAVSELTKRDIINQLGTWPDKIAVVHEGVSLLEQLPEEEVQKTLSQLGIKRPFVLAVGVWRRYKNLLMLARAFSLISRQNHLPHQLVLVGEEDPNYPEIRNDIFAAVSSDKIVVTGKISDRHLSAVYQGANFFVNPSLYEGFGLPALEAQALGTPVISSAIPAAKEVLGSSVLYFEPNAENDLAAKMLTLIQYPHLRNKLSKLGQANCRTYSWEKCAEQTEELYSKTLKNLF